MREDRSTRVPICDESSENVTIATVFRTSRPALVIQSSLFELRRGGVNMPVVSRASACSAAVAAIFTLAVVLDHSPQVPRAGLRRRRHGRPVLAALKMRRTITFVTWRSASINGVARLSGYVWTTPELYAAQKIARGVPGVVRVVNEMQLDRAAARGGSDSGGH